ncbi:Uncharacterized conserved protein PhnB, glyoxalase superfamily [Nonomuraea solani]|uniref:Uncharacterized conserved protein PhnB, glyoxalase superfamily n=1 Tax=Nonomuraea solani TaxID=1144553 RepID=A0A1H6EMM6_9ACTN|nr:hypothetical protein [Nonomuraea solani]SEG98014.1 Uncharacterized conserved protein PhnB, glyoxalase superfamily [Nonomuraea solani]
MTVTPYLMVHSAKQFTEFAAHVFGAEARNVIPLEGDPERVVHGEVRIGESLVYFADARVDGAQCLPPYRKGDDPARVQMYVTWPDPAKAYEAAIAQGATPIVEVTEQEGGTKMGGWVDPFGTLWWVNSATEV